VFALAQYTARQMAALTHPHTHTPVVRLYGNHHKNDIEAQVCAHSALVSCSV